MPDIHLDSRDLFSWRIIIDEGLFIGRIVRHAEKFPNEAIALDITALPFIAVAVHDAIPFINKKLGLHVPLEDLRVTRIRHMTKSLSSNKMDFYDYLSEARAVIDQLNKQFYGGPFPTLLNRFRNNIGITYYGEVPCYTTFSTIHLFTKDSPELLCSKATDLSYEIGYHSGCPVVIYIVLLNRFMQTDLFLMFQPLKLVQMIADSKIWSRRQIALDARTTRYSFSSPNS